MPDLFGVHVEFLSSHGDLFVSLCRFAAIKKTDTSYMIRHQPQFLFFNLLIKLFGCLNVLLNEWLLLLFMKAGRWRNI